MFGSLFDLNQKTEKWLHVFFSLKSSLNIALEIIGTHNWILKKNRLSGDNNLKSKF